MPAAMIVAGVYGSKGRKIVWLYLLAGGGPPTLLKSSPRHRIVCCILEELWGDAGLNSCFSVRVS
jgi:hypothetical protein